MLYMYRLVRYMYISFDVYDCGLVSVSGLVTRSRPSVTLDLILCTSRQNLKSARDLC